jgi:predicted DNA-binding transcriptional regulator AlpA
MTKHFITQAHERIGLSRVQSAEYIGVSPVLFDALVQDGRMPPPKRVNSRLIWDRLEVERYFRVLPTRTISGHAVESVAACDDTT